MGKQAEGFLPPIEQLCFKDLFHTLGEIIIGRKWLTPGLWTEAAGLTGFMSTTSWKFKNKQVTGTKVTVGGEIGQGKWKSSPVFTQPRADKGYRNSLCVSLDFVARIHWN